MSPQEAEKLYLAALEVAAEQVRRGVGRLRGLHPFLHPLASELLEEERALAFPVPGGELRLTLSWSSGGASFAQGSPVLKAERRLESGGTTQLQAFLDPHFSPSSIRDKLEALLRLTGGGPGEVLKVATWLEEYAAWLGDVARRAEEAWASRLEEEKEALEALELKVARAGLGEE